MRAAAKALTNIHDSWSWPENGISQETPWQMNNDDEVEKYCLSLFFVAL